MLSLKARQAETDLFGLFLEMQGSAEIYSTPTQQEEAPVLLFFYNPSDKEGKEGLCLGVLA